MPFSAAALAAYPNVLYTATGAVLTAAQSAGLGQPTGNLYSAGGGWSGQLFQLGCVDTNGTQTYTVNAVMWAAAKCASLVFFA